MKQQFTRQFLKLAGIKRETSERENELIWTKMANASLSERSLFIQYLKRMQHSPEDIFEDFEEIMKRIK
jgi:hypothetical protein